MASSAWRLTSRAASSSRVQWLAGQSCAAVASVARVTASRRSSGGKAPGPAGARGVLQAGQAALGEALAPQADGVAVAVELGGDGLVGGEVVVVGAQDQAAAEGQGLGR